MTSPRYRRLIADGQDLRTEFAGHPNISVTPLEADPCSSYRIVYTLLGVRLNSAGQPEVSNQHEVTVTLGAQYPRQKPLSRTETQVFHPNFGARSGQEICIGDFWSSSRRLVDIVVAIGEMLQYQRYNSRSPLNAVAARWAAENEGVFPIGDVNLYQAEATVSLGAAAGGRGGEILLQPLDQGVGAEAREEAAASAGPEEPE